MFLQEALQDWQSGTQGSPSPHQTRMPAALPHTCTPFPPSHVPPQGTCLGCEFPTGLGFCSALQLRASSQGPHLQEAHLDDVLIVRLAFHQGRHIKDEAGHFNGNDLDRDGHRPASQDGRVDDLCVLWGGEEGGALLSRGACGPLFSQDTAARAPGSSCPHSSDVRPSRGDTCTHGQRRESIQPPLPSQMCCHSDLCSSLQGPPCAATRTQSFPSPLPSSVNIFPAPQDSQVTSHAVAWFFQAPLGWPQTIIAAFPPHCTNPKSTAPLNKGLIFPSLHLRPRDPWPGAPARHLPLHEPFLPWDLQGSTACHLLQEAALSGPSMGTSRPSVPLGSCRPTAAAGREHRPPPVSAHTLTMPLHTGTSGLGRWPHAQALAPVHTCTDLHAPSAVRVPITHAPVTPTGTHRPGRPPRSPWPGAGWPAHPAG